MLKLRFGRVAISSLLVASSLGALACTALLGDFEVLPAGAGSDAGSGADVATDAPVTTSDGAVDAGDAGGDAGSYLLNCVESTSSKMKLADFPRNVDAGGIGSGPPEEISVFVVAQPGGPRGLALAPDDFGVVHAIDFPLSGPGAPADHPMPVAAHLLAKKRYATGLAVLTQRYLPVDGGGAVPILEVFKYPDDGSGWVKPVPLTVPGDIGSLDSCLQNVTATFEVVDANQDDYLIAVFFKEAVRISGNTCGNYAPKLKVSRQKHGTPSAWTSWPIPAGVPSLDLPHDAFVNGNNHAYVMANPQSGPSPAGGDTAILFQADPDTLAPQSSFKVPVKDPNDVLFATGIQDNGGNTVSMGFLEANFSAVGSGTKPTLYVGTIPMASIAQTTPATALPATTLGSVLDLPVDKGHFHFESYANPASRNLFLIGRAVTTGKGINFYWFDGQGHLRAQRAPGAPGGAMMVPANGVLTASANVTAKGSPSPGLANLQIVWSEDHSAAGPNAPYELWTSDVLCVPP